MKRIHSVIIDRGKSISTQEWKAIGAALKSALPRGFRWPSTPRVDPVLISNAQDEIEKRRLQLKDSALRNAEPALTSVVLKYASDDPKFRKVKALLARLTARFEVRVREHVVREYSEQDVKSAPYAVLYLNQKPACDLPGVSQGEVDLDEACPSCWSGAKLVGSIGVLATRQLGRRPLSIETRLNIICSNDMAATIFESGTRGARTSSLHDVRTGKALPWIILSADREVGPVHLSSRAWHRSTGGCDKCHRDCFFDSAGSEEEIRYSQSSLAHGRNDDVVRTWEWFGNSIVSYADPERRLLAVPRLLFSGRLAAKILKLRVRGLRLVPIELVDDR